jgi:ketosteroid isomerase-like protein
MTQKSSDAIALDASHILNVGRWEATVPDPDGRPTTAVVRTTELLVKENGVWRYLVDHASIGAPPPSATRGHRRRRR